MVDESKQRLKRSLGTCWEQMDLQHRGLGGFANLVFNTYLDHGMLQLLHAAVHTRVHLRGVVVDGVVALAHERVGIAAVAREYRVPFTGLWLRAPDDTLRARVARRTNDMSDATVCVLETRLNGEGGEIDWIEIDAAHDPAASASLARAALTRTSGVAAPDESD
ncbi:MAG: hypothetical protein NVSMB19_20760 [Vulcanimicrobiaceae bacterium]